MLKIHDAEKFKERILKHSGSYLRFAADCGACSDRTLRRAVETGYLSLNMAKAISKYLGITMYDLLECGFPPKTVENKIEVKAEPVDLRKMADDILDAIDKLLLPVGLTRVEERKKPSKEKKKHGKKGKKGKKSKKGKKGRKNG